MSGADEPGGAGHLLLRRYRPADHDAVWALHNVALAGTGAYLGHGPWDDDLHHIDQAYLDAGGEFLVGVIDDSVVAMGAIQRKDEAVATLRRMRAHSSCQHRGYGQQVLEALEARATELGCVRIVLDTTTAQTAAIAFYRAHGYVQTGQASVRHFTVVYFERSFPRPEL